MFRKLVFRIKHKQMSLFLFIFLYFRLKVAYEELDAMLKNEKDLEEKDEYVKAVQILEEAKLQII